MKTIKVALMTICLLGGVPGEAGVSSSGGGYAVVCRDGGIPEGRIQKAELLDIFELRNKKGLQVVKTSGSLQEDYIVAVRRGYRLQGYPVPVADSEILNNLEKFFDRIDFTRKNEKLPSTNDLGETLPIPEGCLLEQVAIFYDSTETISIDTEIWNAFDSLNQAALVMHEIAYKYLRGVSHNNSEVARAMVGLDFTSTELETAKSGIPPGAKECRARFYPGGNSSTTGEQFWTVFHYFPHDEERYVIQFTHLFGIPLLTKSAIVVPAGIFKNVPVSGYHLNGWNMSVIFDRASNRTSLQVFQREKLVGSNYIDEFNCF